MRSASRLPRSRTCETSAASSSSRRSSDVFLADAPALITSLRSSLERQDTEELRRAAHTLKSNGSTLGAAAFAELCRTVEQHAKDGRLDGVSQLVDRIEQQYQTVQEALASLGSEQVS